MSPPVGVTTAAVWVCLWVSTPMTASTPSASMVMVALPIRVVTVIGVGLGHGYGAGRTVMGHTPDGVDRLLIRPTPRRPGPAPTASRQTDRDEGHPEATPRGPVRSGVMPVRCRRQSERSPMAGTVPSLTVRSRHVQTAGQASQGRCGHASPVVTLPRRTSQRAAAASGQRPEPAPRRAGRRAPELQRGTT